MRNLMVFLGTVGLFAALGCKQSASPPPSSTPPASTGEADPRYPTSGNGSGVPLRPPAWFQPMDWSTAVQGTPLQLAVTKGGDSVSEELLKPGLALHLRTWPEQEVVPSTVKVVAYRAAAGGADKNGYVILEPLAPLQDRWYLLRLPGWPSGWDQGSFPLHTVFENGAVGVRFRPGSQPLWNATRVCQKSPEISAVYLDFSERVAFDRPLASVSLQVRQLGTVASCRFSTGASPPPSLNYLRYECTGLDYKAPVSLELGPGMISVESSVPLSMPAGRAFQFVSADAPLRVEFLPVDYPESQGCHIYRQ